MTFPIIIDFILATVLILFIWLGARRGFILTLCSLAAVIVALVGANLIADALAPKAAQAIQPRLEQSIQESLEQKALEVSAQDGLGVAEALAALGKELALLSVLENLAQYLAGDAPILRPGLLAAALPREFLACLYLIVAL